MSEMSGLDTVAREVSDLLPVVTPWQFPDPASTEPADKELDRARDYLFRQMVIQVLHEQAPWLVPILRAADATVAAYPGKFIVYLNNRFDTPHEIPHLGTYLMLTPWVDSSDIAH